jgi:hypothetical protein
VKNNLLFAIYIGKFPFKDIENAGRKTQTQKSKKKDGSNRHAGICTLVQYIHYHTVYQLLKTVKLSADNWIDMQTMRQKIGNETTDRQ